MNPRRLALAVLAATVVSAAACTTDEPSAVDASSTTAGTAFVAGTTPGTTPGTIVRRDGELVIGLLVPRTGGLAQIGDALSAPAALAVEQINAAGGIDGEPVTLVEADDGSDPDVARASLEELVEQEGANVVVGPSSSTTARGIMDEIRDGGVPVCSGSAYAADLAEADSGGLFVRTVPSDLLQARALAGVIAADGRTSVAILSRDDDYGDDFSEALANELFALNVPVSQQLAYDPTGEGVAEVVTQGLVGSPDAVVILGFTDDGAAVVRELIAQGAGPDTIGVYGSDGLRSATFSEAVDPDPAKVAGITGTAPAPAPTGLESPFTAAFAEVLVDGEAVTPVFSAHVWDCVNLLALAAVQADSTDPGAIAEAFATSFEGETDCVDFASCAALLAEGETIHYRGASNTFDDWDGTQPGHGAYLEWSYLPDGTSVTESTQLDV